MLNGLKIQRMNMNLNKIFYGMLITGLVLASCNESEDLVTEDAKEGGLLTSTSNSLNYVVGNPDGPYTMEFYVHQLKKERIAKINLYKSFTSTVKYTVMKDGEEVVKDTTFVSNEILDHTIDIATAENQYVSANYTLTQLIEGLTVNSMSGPAAPLSDDDLTYNIGDKWVFRVETVLENGRVVQQAAPVSVSVSTRYAGKYKAVQAAYYRLGVETGVTSDWPEETVIESVDPSTYRVVEYFGMFEGNEFYFQIDVNGNITYPAKTPTGEDQTGNGQPFLICQDMTPDDQAKVNCGNSNYVVNNDDNGKDRLIMSFGYNTPGSGPRTFYQVLEKIVE